MPCHLAPLTVEGGRNDGVMHVSAPMWCVRSHRLAERLQAWSAPCLERTHAWLAAETSEELQQRNKAAEPNLLNQAAKFECSLFLNAGEFGWLSESIGACSQQHHYSHG
ncbi:uncharacterized protein [Triticum aestivum]|uniref:uncharacterized protein n=1 Tax=Triticum aestivum TaxID=4565 RepID=UPI001D01A764|nr:uncharacterized protein LOC123069526 [Triticum aestivum]